jgi:hypothetical protein
VFIYGAHAPSLRRLKVSQILGLNISLFRKTLDKKHLLFNNVNSDSCPITCKLHLIPISRNTMSLSRVPNFTRDDLADLVVLALLLNGGRYTTKSNFAAKELLAVTWPDPPTEVTAPLRKAVERMVERERIVIDYTPAAPNRPRRIRSIRYIGKVDLDELARLLKLRADFIIALGLPMLPNGASPHEKGVYTKIMRYVETLQDELRTFKDEGDRRVTTLTEENTGLKLQVREFQHDLEVARTDSSARAAEIFVARLTSPNN